MPVGVLAVLAMVVLPLPPIALDVLFTFNIALSIVIVMAVFYVSRPIEFGVFPDRTAARDVAAPRAERRLHPRRAAARPHRRAARPATSSSPSANS